MKLSILYMYMKFILSYNYRGKEISKGNAFPCFQIIVSTIFTFSVIYNLPYFFTAGLSQGLLCSAVACSSVSSIFVLPVLGRYITGFCKWLHLLTRHLTFYSLEPQQSVRQWMPFAYDIEANARQ